MAPLRIMSALITMFSLTRCYELSFVLDFPQIMDSITNMASHALSPRAQKDSGLEVPTLTERLTKMSWDVFGYMATLLSAVSRRMNYEQMKPNVEVGPGVIKSEIVSYPPNYFVDRIKYLLQSKQKQEELNKPPIKT